MGELWQDFIAWLMVAIVALTLWTYVPAAVAQRLLDGLGRLAQALGLALGAVARLAQRGLYRLLTGRPLPAAVKASYDPALRYVPPPMPAAPVSAPSAGSVRPSVPASAPDRPAAPPAVTRLTVDRSRDALVEALVAAGWSKTQIRDVLKGANDAVAAEVDAARARLEAAAEPRETPIAQRPTAAQFRKEPEPAA